MEAGLFFKRDDGSFEDAGVFDERALHFDWRHPLARDSKHVVGSTGVPVVTILVDRELIACKEPAPAHAVLSQSRTIPIAWCSAGASHQQISDGPARHWLTRMVDQRKFIAGHRLACASSANLSGTRGKIDMQNFSGTDAVQNLNSKALLPTAKDIRGQRLSGRSRQTNRGQIVSRILSSLL